LNTYELLYFSDPRITDEDTTALKDRIMNLIRDNGGEIVQENDWGVRRLAYTVNKIDDGHYFLLNFKSNPTFLTTLDRQLRLFQNVVRFMIVKEGE
jgi:small subunit ribosomal protein S6